MNAIRAYANATKPAPFRIDVVLELYDELTRRLTDARAQLHDNRPEADRLLLRCRVALSGLAAGIAASPGDLSAHFQSLYEYAGRVLLEPTENNIDTVLSIVGTLREGFEAIRPQALDLERSGQVPSLERHQMQTMA